MKIFVIVGMPAAGKNIARLVAQSKGVPYFATGDRVREEVRRRGLPPTAENTANVSDELRGSDGMGVTRLVLSYALQSHREFVFLEGMRSWPEIELIRKESPCVVVAFVAPRDLRLARVMSRGRSDDSPAGFEEREKREISYGTAIPIARADEYILNTGTVEDGSKALEQIVGKYAE